MKNGLKLYRWFLKNTFSGKLIHCLKTVKTQWQCIAWWHCLFCLTEIEFTLRLTYFGLTQFWTMVLHSSTYPFYDQLIIVISLNCELYHIHLDPFKESYLAWASITHLNQRESELLLAPSMTSYPIDCISCHLYHLCPSRHVSKSVLIDLAANL